MTNDKQINTPSPSPIQRHKGWLLGFGIVLLILGFIGLGMEFMLTLASMYFFAALLLISSLSHFADAFKYKGFKGILWQIFIALLYLLASLVIVYDPLLASTMITALLAWLLIIIGISRIIMAFYLKETPGWGYILFAGLCSLILGLLIFMQWPISGLWVIGMFIAIDLIISGWTYIFMAFSIRSA
ncbi:HdeD family acid-resistance protein [Legionella sp. km772]|uniref:HdeD family acid-resistance protein n=1 Tax=Legionella sp. km772 TaxID=2498111 RepID=UPI000F8CF30C|nr:DUF308 domain-containing protein [Legionella sp. km772]RUR09802.1 HdeD family acid-resistance protein [Legionella sp. km772]